MPLGSAWAGNIDVLTTDGLATRSTNRYGRLMFYKSGGSERSTEECTGSLRTGILGSKWEMMRRVCRGDN